MIDEADRTARSLQLADQGVRPAAAAVATLSSNWSHMLVCCMPALLCAVHPAGDHRCCCCLLIHGAVGGADVETIAGESSGIFVPVNGVIKQGHLGR